MQGNIRIVLTLSILKKKKNTVTTHWIKNKNKINEVHNANLCFIEFKVGNWSEKKTSLLYRLQLCVVSIADYHMLSTAVLIAYYFQGIRHT